MIIMHENIKIFVFVLGGVCVWHTLAIVWYASWYFIKQNILPKYLNIFLIIIIVIVTLSLLK